MSKSVEIVYSTSAEKVGIFPHFPKSVKHGFSWGRGNMALGWEFTPEGKIQAQKRVNEFLTGTTMSYIPIGVCLEPCDDGEQIQFIDHEKMNTHLTNQARLLYSGIISSPEPMSAQGNFVWTFAHGLTLFVKPADCPSAVLYYQDSRDEFIGILHAGRNQLDMSLPEQVFLYLTQQVGCDLKHLSIGISPAIFPRHYTIRKDDWGLIKNPDTWKDYSIEQGEYIHLNLSDRLYDSCLNAGVPEKQIFQYQVDTYEAAQKELSFSHRYATQHGTTNGRYILAAQMA